MDTVQSGAPRVTDGVFSVWECYFGQTKIVRETFRGLHRSTRREERPVGEENIIWA